MSLLRSADDKSPFGQFVKIAYLFELLLLYLDSA